MNIYLTRGCLQSLNSCMPPLMCFCIYPVKPCTDVNMCACVHAEYSGRVRLRATQRSSLWKWQLVSRAVCLARSSSMWAENRGAAFWSHHSLDSEKTHRGKSIHIHTAHCGLRCWAAEQSENIMFAIFLIRRFPRDPHSLFSHNCQFVSRFKVSSCQQITAAADFNHPEVKSSW